LLAERDVAVLERRGERGIEGLEEREERRARLDVEAVVRAEHLHLVQRDAAPVDLVPETTETRRRRILARRFQRREARLPAGARARLRAPQGEGGEGSEEVQSDDGEACARHARTVPSWTRVRSTEKRGPLHGGHDDRPTEQLACCLAAAYDSATDDRPRPPL